MSTINEIPFSYLVLWAKNNKGIYPGLTYLQTLSQKFGDSHMGLWKDVIPKIPNNQSYKKLSLGLKACESTILRDYAEDSQTQILPANASVYSSFYERVKAFIIEYRTELEKYRGTLSDDKYEKQQNRAAVLREMYQYSRTHSEPLDRGVIAHHLSITRQRIDQYIDTLSNDCYNCLSGKKVGRIIADPMLVSEFKEFEKKAGTMISKETLQRSFGLNSSDGKTLEFLVNALGMCVMEQKTGVRIPIIAKKGLLGDYSKRIGEVIDYFRKEVFGIRLDYELKDMLSQIEDDGLRDAIKSLIMNSDEFIRYQDGSDAAVALRWDHLLTISARICWILYNKKAFDYKTAIYKDELIKLYNGEAKRYKEKRITTTQLPTKGTIDSSGCLKLMSLGKTGYWKIRSNPKEDFNLDDIIRDYLRSKGADASFEDFLIYLKGLGLDGKYKERSLRSRYKCAGGATTRAKASTSKKATRLSKADKSIRYRFILNHLKTLGATCTLLDLHTVFCKSYPSTPSGTLNAWVKDLAKQKKINIIPGTGRRPTYISDCSVPISIPRTLIDDVLDSAQDIIWLSPNHQILSKELYPQLISLLPNTMTSKVQRISKAIMGDSRFVSTGSKGHSTISLSKTAQLEMAKKHPGLTSSAALRSSKLTLNEAEVKKCLMAEFSKELTEFGIDAESAINKLIITLGRGKTIPDNFSFYDALTYLPLHYQATLEADRERTLKNDSLALVELFLKNFYQMQNGGDIIEDIKRDWPTVKNLGLSTIMSYLYQKYNYLPYKAYKVYGDYTTFSPEEKKVLQMVNWVKEARNQQVGHRGQLEDTSKYNKEKSIHDSFFVMLYVASKLSCK